MKVGEKEAVSGFTPTGTIVLRKVLVYFTQHLKGKTKKSERSSEVFKKKSFY